MSWQWKERFFSPLVFACSNLSKSLLLSITTTCSASCTCCCERGAFFIGRIYVLRKADVTVQAIPETHAGRVIFFSFLDFLFFFFYYDHIQRSYFLSLKQFIFNQFVYHFFTIGCSSHLMAKEPGSTRAISACSLIDDGVHFVHVELVAESSWNATEERELISSSCSPLISFSHIRTLW